MIKIIHQTKQGKKGDKEAENNQVTQNEQNEMVKLTQNTKVVTLKQKVLNSSINRQRLSEWVKKRK